MVDATGQPYAYTGDNPVNGTDPLGLCWPSWACGVEHAIGRGYTNTVHAFDCLRSACYTTKQGASNAVAGGHNTLNYLSGLPPVPAPYPCSNSDAYALGGLVPYAPLLFLPGGEAAEAGGAAAASGDAVDSAGSVLKGAIPDEGPQSLYQQIALQNAMAGDGEVVPITLGDAPRLNAIYGQGDWVKMQYVLRNQDDDALVTVHYFRNLTSGQDVEFKFTK
jgi:hypothetical protein